MKKTNNTNFDVKDMASETIEKMVEVMINQIEASDGDWDCEWLKFGDYNYRNYVSNKKYEGGANLFMLSAVNSVKGNMIGDSQISGYYITQKQAFDLGWSLKSEYKTWTLENKDRQKTYDDLKTRRQDLYKRLDDIVKTKKKSGQDYKTIEETDDYKDIYSQISDLSRQMTNVMIEIIKHMIWQTIIFWTPVYYQYTKEDDKYYYKTLIVNNRLEVTGVKSVKEVTKDDYDKWSNDEKIQYKFAARYYYVANIEYYNQPKTIKGRDSLLKKKELHDYSNVDYQNHPLYLELMDYALRENIKVTFDKQDRAYYSLKDDAITLPDVGQFDSINAMLSTFAHESGHSTGAKSRLHRFDDFIENKEAYCSEELVAETTSMLLMSDYGMFKDKTAKNTFAYLKGYLEECHLNDKKTNMFFAINAAKKAHDYILDCQKLDEESLEEGKEE